MLPSPPACVAVAHAGRTGRPAAEALAERLGLPLAKGFRDPHPLHLRFGPDGRLGIEVVEAGHPLFGGHPVAADLLALDTTSPAGRKLATPFFKAMGVRRGMPERPRVFDATAGLGEDAWLLASAGCRVEAVERNPIVLALLADALARAADRDPATAARLTVRGAEALDALRTLASGPPAERPEVVALDPMFPLGRRATERKPMRVLRMLEAADAVALQAARTEAAGPGRDQDRARDRDRDQDQPGPDAEAALLEAACDAATRRVAVKRPSKAPPLGGVKPQVVFAGKAVRFDVYLRG